MNDQEPTQAIPEDDVPAPEPEPEAGPNGDELAEILEAVEDAQAAREKREEPVAEGAPAAVAPTASEDGGGGEKEAPASAGASGEAAAEQSGSYVYPDGGAAASQRLRLIPPDGKPAPWWVKHRKTLTLVEMVLTGVFFLLALYFLYVWIFSEPAVAFGPDPSWKVASAPGRWTQIVVHHTATEAGTAESIDRNHREVRKWENGLGYHFLIGNGMRDAAGASMGDGEVHASRRWREQLDGAHVVMPGTKKGNSFSIGIALVGNFEKKPPTPNQVSALRCLLGFLLSEYDISRNKVVGHGEVGAKYTECPGAKLPLREIVDSL